MPPTLARLAFFSYAGVIIVLALLPPGDTRIEVWDKLAHAVAYALFGLIGFAAFRRWREFAIACCGIIALGVALEFAQGLVPGRQPSALDALANAVGVMLAVLICLAWNRLSRKTRNVTSGTSPL